MNSQKSLKGSEKLRVAAIRQDTLEARPLIERAHKDGGGTMSVSGRALTSLSSIKDVQLGSEDCPISNLIKMFAV